MTRMCHHTTCVLEWMHAGDHEYESAAAAPSLPAAAGEPTYYEVAVALQKAEWELATLRSTLDAREQRITELEKANDALREQGIHRRQEDGARPMSTSEKGRIAEIERRMSRATPGPWIVGARANPLNDLGLSMFPDDIRGREPERWIITGWDHGQLQAPVPITGLASSCYFDRETTICIEANDAEFIAHARDDVPFLLAELASREARIGELEKEVEQLRLRITSTEIAT